MLFPGDLIPFTRKPLFLIIDSDNSHAFKAGLLKLCRVTASQCFSLRPTIFSDSSLSASIPPVIC